ncbi:hypothetical protein RR48_11007 [Papilio machaon]|uniref:Uncharacterized protein n=1 Tax=Papilio machaon TaxID=76193 RepID=A0A194RPY9_PAPMA|nr:hypothetical protein RR48_11007 [Papilio machaon]
MQLEETVIDDGEFNMDELMTFNRPPLDHDYQLVKSFESKLPSGYRDLPIDEDWPPNLKKRMKKLEFDYGDGKDYLSIVKEDNYENFRKIDSKIETPKLFDIGVINDALLATTRKLGELLNSSPSSVLVKNEDLVVEEVDHDVRNHSEVKSFVVSGNLNEY